MYSHAGGNVEESTIRHGVRILRTKAQLVREVLLETGVIDLTLLPLQIDDESICFPLLTSIEHSSSLQTILEADPSIEIEEYAFEKKSKQRSPKMQLQELVQLYATQANISFENLQQGIPEKWERLGQLLLFPKDAFEGQAWSDFFVVHGIGFFVEIAKIFDVESIGKQQPISKNNTRDAQVKILLGDSWVEFKQHQVYFGFDAAKVMFSSGNITERERMANLDVTDEVILDVFAGVGYYTLPIAVHGTPKKIHAFEINPLSIQGLSWGIQKNNVEHIVDVHAGDNLQNLPQFFETADRCILGLLPSSESVWELCFDCLKQQGGVLHIHMNVEEERIESWVEETVDFFESLAISRGKKVTVTAMHLEKVKWYAPRIRHVVLDLDVNYSA
jgi:tRNA wybutosine-synthesizing protein 3